ncbi:MAG: hypothetical protein V5A55_15205 [Halovenus sp.]
MRPLEYIKVCLEWKHLKRTGLITVVVGTWLTLFNQGDLLLIGDINMWLFGKIFLNYLTPFMVSNAGLLSRESDGTHDE